MIVEKIDKRTGQKRIMERVAKWQKTGKKECLADVQEIVNAVGEKFELVYKTEGGKHQKIVFAPKERVSESGIVLP